MIHILPFSFPWRQETQRNGGAENLLWNKDRSYKPSQCPEVVHWSGRWENYKHNRWHHCLWSSRSVFPSRLSALSFETVSLSQLAVASIKIAVPDMCMFWFMSTELFGILIKFHVLSGLWTHHWRSWTSCPYQIPVSETHTIQSHAASKNVFFLHLFFSKTTTIQTSKTG